MNQPVKTLNFVWWNVQDFAHFDIIHANDKRWPDSHEAFVEKRKRIEHVLIQLSTLNPPELLAFAEITDQAARDLRNRLFPNYKVHYLPSLYTEPNFHVAILYKQAFGFTEEDFLSVSNVPATTRPMAILDYCSDGQAIRFFVCHLTTRFDESSKKWRKLSVSQLSSEIYKFLHPEYQADETRHVVVLGDFNEEPYGMMEEWLYAFRNRTPSRRPEHYTDSAIERVRLYNCAWRLLGENHPHPILPNQREVAGSYYWRDKRTWHTFDQVIVSGSLLGSSPPYFDEKNLYIVSHVDVMTDEIIGNDNMPQKYKWNDGEAKGVSDHLPICGKIILK